MPKCQLYKDVKGEWRWRRQNKKGDIEAFSKQGFENEEDCKKNGKEEGNCTSFRKGAFT